METASPAPIQPGSGAMFDRIATRYDLLNRLISLGIDQRWRRRTVAALELASEGRVLDLATGTADLALLIARTYPDVSVVGVDPSANMLAVAQQKLVRAKLEQRVQLLSGVAETLPFDDASFAGTTIAFGIRNVPDRSRALREMARVTRPGGRVCILELSEPQSGVLSWAARFHMHTVIPSVGALLSGAGAYRYLPRSIAAFPAAQEFAAMMTSAGLNVVKVEPLTFGVCHLFVGVVR